MKLALQIVLILSASVVAALIGLLVIMGPGEEQIPDAKDTDLILDPKPIVKDDMPSIDDELPQNDIGYVAPPLLTKDDHILMQQRFDRFVENYQSLILAQRNVMPNAIDFSYVIQEGFTDKDQGIKYCTIMDNHIANVESLFGGLKQSLVQLELIEVKSPEVNDLINYKYKVLSGVMFKEVNTLKYKYHSVDCNEVFGDLPRIDHAGDKILAD